MADGTSTTPQGAGGNTPPPWAAGVPEKFLGATAEETLQKLSKSYTELEKMRSQPNQAAPVYSYTTTPQEGDFDPGSLITKAGLNPQDVVDQIKAHGELTDEQYQAIRKTNPAISRSLAKQLAKGAMAEYELTVAKKQSVLSQAAAAVGGDKELKTLIAAIDEYVPENQRAFMRKMISDDTQAVAAASMLKDMYEKAATGGNVKPLIGGTAPSSGSLNAESLKKIRVAAQNGDFDAINQLKAIPLETIMRLS